MVKHTFLVAYAVALLTCAPLASALESDSFVLRGGIGEPNAPAASPTYQLSGGITWLPTYAASQSSASSASSASSEPSSAGASTVVNGGHGTPPVPSSAFRMGPSSDGAAPSSSSARPRQPHAPGSSRAAAPQQSSHGTTRPPVVPADAKPAAPDVAAVSSTGQHVSAAPQGKTAGARLLERRAERRAHRLSQQRGGTDLFRLVEQAAAFRAPWSAVVAVALAVILAAVCLVASIDRRRKAKPGPRRKRRSAAFWLCLALMVTGTASPFLHRLHTARLTAHAQTSVPQRLAYNGRLLTQAGDPVTTAHTLRFSFWDSADAVSGDWSGGSINTGAATYADWQETFTVTPDSQGYFSVELGSTVDLPDMGDLSFGTLLSLYLQVEVKPQASPDADYELLDPNAGDDTVDRTGILSVPFALNADMVDTRSIGTGSGSIPLLGSGGLLPAIHIPDDLLSDILTIDSDDSSATPTLQFGTTLGKQLSYDSALTRFTFNDDLHIEGSLTLTGTINGIDIVALATQVASGAIMNVTFQPEFTGASYEADGSDNTGQLSLGSDDETGQQRYVWQTTRSAAQDYDIVVRYRLPEDFSAWEAVPLTVDYRTTTNDSDDNAITVTVTDTAGSGVTLTGGVDTLVNSAWSQASGGFDGSPTWTPGEEMTIRFTVKATNGNLVKLGAFTLALSRE